MKLGNPNTSVNKSISKQLVSYREVIRILDVINTDKSARELLDHRVLLINRHSYFKNDICCSNGEYVEDLRRKGHHIHIVPFPRSFSFSCVLKTIWRTYRILKDNEYDIVHTHGSLVGLIGRIAAFCAGTPIVIHQVHGFHHHDAMHFIKRWFYIYAERALSFLTDKFLFQSVEALEECLRLHIARRRKTDLIYNGICLDSFLDEWQEASVGRIILCVARFDSVKNHSMLFEAAKLLKERGTAFELWLCGTGVLETKYRKWVTDNCLEKHVIFMGYRDDIHELMGKANLCVLTSYKEGIAKTIMEAAAAGKPMVTTEVKGNREAVIDGKTGFLIRLNDIVTLAEKMAHLLDDENLRKKIGLNAKNYARKHFDEVEVVARITRVYTEMYTSKVSPPSQARGNGRLFET